MRNNRFLYINGRFFTQAITGTQRYGRELIRELDALLQTDDRIKVEILVPASTVAEIPDYCNLTVRRVGKLTGHAWEQLELPFYAWRGVLFCPVGGAPILHPRSVVTIHDVAVYAMPSGFTFAFGRWYRFLYWALGRRARHILTVSNFSKNEIVRWCRIPPEKITVTHLGSEHAKAVAADSSILQRHDLKRYGYVLAASTRNPNKNLARLIESLQFWDMPEMDFALAGKGFGAVYPSLKLRSSSIKELGHVTDQELRSLYENAACFVFPSLYEGFGLPPLEALALGCPVVAADAASLPEILAEAAIYCDPYDPTDIAQKIHSQIRSQHNPESRMRLSLFAEQYSWKKCAQETWRVLSDVTFDKDPSSGTPQSER